MAVAAFRMMRLFAEVSLTGSRCELMCSHCRGVYLRHMLHPDPKPGGVMRLLERLYRLGVRGVLLSGGLRRDGSLMVGGEVIDELWEAKRRLGLVFNMHTGFERRREILERLVGLVDVVDYEVSLSEWMVRRVRRLEMEPRETLRIMEMMLELGLDVVPHVYLWHPASTPQLLREELRAVDDLGARMVTLLVYIPPPWDKVELPPAEKLVSLLKLAREVWPRELSLGCMRPYQVKRFLDAVAVEEGLVDRIANPYQPLARKALAGARWYDACCSLPDHLLHIFAVEAPSPASRWSRE